MSEPWSEPIASSPKQASRAIAASAFDQVPTVIAVLEGPELTVVAWNPVAERIARPTLGGLGSSVWDAELIQGTGIQEAMRRVYDTGEPFTARGWRFSVPDGADQLRDLFLDFTYSPWRRSDGTIRGVLATATDVTEATNHPNAAEAEAQSWQELFETSRDAMVALQSALLPTSVPVIPGLQIGARYLLAESNAAAGGDWFSAYYTAAERVVLVVGDVVGHGVKASATMGQLRAVLKSRLLGGTPLAAALEALDAFAASLPGADAATVCAVLIDPATGAAEYCTAGHPPPLLVDRSGWHYLEPTGAGPLGSGRGFVTSHVTVPEDGLLLLLTDGLIERPGIEWSASIVEIGEVVANAFNGRPLLASAATNAADRVCEQALELLTRTSRVTDDITLLAAHRVDPPANLTTRLAVEAGVVSAAVLEIERWLTGVDAGDADQLHLRHAIVELVTNSVEHGLDGRSAGHVDLQARLTDSGHALIDISDDGQWKEPKSAPGDAAGNGRLRGLGLPMVRQLVDNLVLDHDASGTHVRVRQRLSRPAPLVTTPVSSPGHKGQPTLDAELTIHSDPDRPGTVYVHGPVLSRTAARLANRLDLESRAGTRSLTVDLDDVTHLTSAGVRVLQNADRVSRRHGRQLQLRARPGCVAHNVLGLLGISIEGTSQS